MTAIAVAAVAGVAACDGVQRVAVAAGATARRLRFDPLRCCRSKSLSGTADQDYFTDGDDRSDHRRTWRRIDSLARDRARRRRNALQARARKPVPVIARELQVDAIDRRVGHSRGRQDSHHRRG